MQYRISSADSGHAMHLLDAVERAMPGDVIIVNNEHLASNARFKADQLGKSVEVVIEEEEKTDGEQSQ